MVFEKRGVARIKANAMASESISDYAGFVKSGSATESLDEGSRRYEILRKRGSGKRNSRCKNFL